MFVSHFFIFPIKRWIKWTVSLILAALLGKTVGAVRTIKVEKPRPMVFLQSLEQFGRIRRQDCKS
jgi:short subunit fatty acids transporter